MRLLCSRVRVATAVPMAGSHRQNGTAASGGRFSRTTLVVVWGVLVVGAMVVATTTMAGRSPSSQTGTASMRGGGGGEGSEVRAPSSTVREVSESPACKKCPKCPTVQAPVPVVPPPQLSSVCTAGEIAMAMLEVAEQDERVAHAHEGAGTDEFCNPGAGMLIPQMSPREWRVLMESVAGVSTYVEWGTGGSSETVAPHARRSYSIEHYQPWCKCVLQRPALRCLANKGVYKHQCVDTGIEMVNQGNPDPKSKHNTREVLEKGWYAYVDAIDNFGVDKFDFIFIDGRARVGCALKALAYVHDQSVVVVHDWKRRAYRKSLAKYFDVIKEVPGKPKGEVWGLGFLRAKPEYVGNTEVYHTMLNVWL